MNLAKINKTFTFLGSALSVGVATGLAAAIASSSVSAAEDFKIEGKMNGLDQTCTFFAVQDGEMAYNESNFTWYTQDEAKIRVRTRDVDSVSITNDGNLRDAQGIVDVPENIDYSMSSVATENPRNVAVVESATGENDFTVTQLDGGNVLNIRVNHTVKSTDSFVAENDVNYFVQNTATCVQ